MNPDKLCYCAKQLPSKHLFKPTLILLLIFQLIAAGSLQKAYAGATFYAGLQHSTVFDSVLKVPSANRITAAISIYRKCCRHIAATSAMKNLDDLENIALKLNDRSLECQVFDFRADYYSVNDGFNSLSRSYYQQAINFAIDNNMPAETGYRLHRMGLFYRTFRKNTLACRYFLLSQEKFRQVGYGNVPQISVYLSEVASFYYTLGDYETAKSNLLEALKYNKGSVRDIISITNTIGLIYRNNKQYPQALGYFNKALRLAVLNKDTVWTGIVNGNIGSIYFLENQYGKALPLITQDYKTSLKYNDPVNGTIALLRLVKIDMANNENSYAKGKLDTAERLLKGTKQDVLGIWADFFNLKASLLKKQGNSSAALNFTQQFMAAKDSLSKRDNMAAVERVRLSWESERHLAQMNKLRDEEKLASLRRNAVIGILFLLVVIILLILNQQRIKAQKEKALLSAEKRRVDEELQNASLELGRYTQNLKQNNKLLEKITAEIELLQSRSADQAGFEQLESLKQAHIMTDESWTDFKRIFTKVHGNFFLTLQKRYPQLTQTDARLLALIKLQLNNREMAGMLGITIEGIKKSKQRLRKKMDLTAEDDIENLVAEL